MHVGATLKSARFFDDVALPMRASVRVRYRHEAVPATIARGASGVSVAFDEPVRAVSRGQVAVVYAGDRVIGGGTIDRVLAATRADNTGALA